MSVVVLILSALIVANTGPDTPAALYLTGIAGLAAATVHCCHSIYRHGWGNR